MNKGIFKITFIYFFLVSVHMCVCKKHRERTVYKIQFSASTMWVPQVVRLGNRQLYLFSHPAA